MLELDNMNFKHNLNRSSAKKSRCYSLSLLYEQNIQH